MQLQRRTVINRHVEEVKHHIPTPKSTAKAAVSEAIAAAWVKGHRAQVDDEADEEHDMFFEVHACFARFR